LTRAPRASLLDFGRLAAGGPGTGFSWCPHVPLSPGIPYRVAPRARVPAVLSHRSTGISACRPSATALALVLGPDSPREDQLYPGILGYSAVRISTLLSLLIPAFSLPDPPRVLVGRASPGRQCSPTNPSEDGVQSFGGVFEPRSFSAQGLSTSELLRTL
jgi:hypothetical protein